MASFPTTFVAEHIPITPGLLEDEGAEAMDRLQHAGFEVVAGLRRAEVPEITAIAKQEGVREFCPRDLTKRFPDEETVEYAWLPKNGGRAVFLLRRLGKIAGYSWTGQETCPELPECETTFAIRLHEDMAGKGLGAPYTSVTVFASMALYNARKIGLETWGSNGGAVSSYVKAGARLVRVKDDMRPTLHPAANETDGMRRDTRMFMQFPQTFAA